MGSSTLRRRTSFRAVGSHRPRGTHPVIHILIVLLVAFTMLTSGASAATILFYGQNLPTLKNFSHRFQFQNSEIRDSQGHLLYTLTSASGIRRVVEPLRMPGATTRDYKARGERWLVGPHTPGIPLALQNATVATEDATFWNNLGFDPLSIARAAYDNFTKGHVVSGASTITQQLVREYMLKDTPSYTRKAKEVILAAELTQKYQKSEILYYYLNSVPYGNQSTGAQAAAKTYFHKNVWQLDLAQAAMLAGLPEAPSLYDPVSNRAVAFKRMRYVLQLMYDHGYLVNSHGQRDYGLIQRYMAETINPAKFPIFKPPVAGKKYPQFVQYAVSQLQNIPQLQGKLNDGLNVITTLNPQLQNAAQSIVTQQVNGLGYYNVTDGALVSMDTSPGCRGCILAMVGSADYNNAAIAGQINMANTPRQPGSSFKPFNYVYAFTHGLSPGTSVLDGPIAIPDVGNQGDGGWYEPTDYDNTWHGVVPLRLALDNSLNVPAVRVEQYNASLKGGTAAAIRETVAQQAIKMGISSLLKDNTNCCGWALTLGGLEHGVRLIQETSAYGAFATGGITDPPIAIKYVYDRTTHKLLYSYRQKDRVDKPHRVISPQAAYVMNNVLSDNAARCAPQVCEFGLDSPLYVGRPAGAKTGTTNAFTDNWTVGYTPQIVTGVWVGNANDSPMVNSTGITGAAPIWNAFMLRAFQILKLPVADFNEPSGVYLGSTCREPGPYYSLGTMETDIYTGAVPLCSIGDLNGTLPQGAPQGPTLPKAVPTVAPATPTALPAATSAVPGAQPGIQPNATAASPPTAVPVQPTTTALPALPTATSVPIPTATPAPPGTGARP